ncbi:flagellar hook-length control protein FliK [Dongshaea marina]|uniref:flagellar hook-length control protein FliK n=1 Tax=Dongshaea marina TaxID=2047966 RepID=UPI000D3EA0F6|nr:flagellar hook-length control protein FliK [Dongshaea marina]
MTSLNLAPSQSALPIQAQAGRGSEELSASGGSSEQAPQGFDKLLEDKIQQAPQGKRASEAPPVESKSEVAESREPSKPPSESVENQSEDGEVLPREGQELTSEEEQRPLEGEAEVEQVSLQEPGVEELDEALFAGQTEEELQGAELEDSEDSLDDAVIPGLVLSDIESSREFSKLNLVDSESEQVSQDPDAEAALEESLIAQEEMMAESVATASEAEGSVDDAQAVSVAAAMANQQPKSESSHAQMKEAGLDVSAVSGVKAEQAKQPEGAFSSLSREGGQQDSEQSLGQQKHYFSQGQAEEELSKGDKLEKGRSDWALQKQNLGRTISEFHGLRERMLASEGNLVTEQSSTSAAEGFVKESSQGIRGVSDLAAALRAERTASGSPIDLPSMRLTANPDNNGLHLGQRLQMMLNQRLQRAEIQLEPETLGRIQISLQVNNDQAHLQITTSQPQTREVLEQTLPRLRELLAQSGINLSEANIQYRQEQQDASEQSAAEGEQLASGAAENEVSAEEGGSSQGIVRGDWQISDRIDFYA